MSKQSMKEFPPELQLRIAVSEDAELIADLSRSTFFDTFYAQNDPSNINLFLREQFTRSSLIAEVGMPGNTFVLAYADNEVAGYMKLRDGIVPPELGTANTLEIARIYATQKMVGRGVGKRLMEYAHETAVAMGRQSIWLAVWEKNPRALRFYENWGFRIVGKQVFVLGLDLQTDWIMQEML